MRQYDSYGNSTTSLLLMGRVTSLSITDHQSQYGQYQFEMVIAHKNRDTSDRSTDKCLQSSFIYSIKVPPTNSTLIADHAASWEYVVTVQHLFVVGFRSGDRVFVVDQQWSPDEKPSGSRGADEEPNQNHPRSL